MSLRVRYYGHVGQLTGYGRAAADMCMSLLAAGPDAVELEIVPLGAPTKEEAALALARYVPLRDCLRRAEDLHLEPDVCIVHTLPLDCGTVLDRAFDDPDLDPELPWVAYTTWEAASPISRRDGARAPRLRWHLGAERDDGPVFEVERKVRLAGAP